MLYNVTNFRWWQSHYTLQVVRIKKQIPVFVISSSGIRWFCRCVLQSAQNTARRAVWRVASRGATNVTALTPSTATMEVVKVRVPITGPGRAPVCLSACPNNNYWIKCPLNLYIGLICRACSSLHYRSEFTCISRRYYCWSIFSVDNTHVDVTDRQVSH